MMINTIRPPGPVKQRNRETKTLLVAAVQADKQVVYLILRNFMTDHFR